MMKSKKRIVVKVGTRVVTASKEGLLEGEGARLPGLVREIAALRSSDQEVILVTSGAIGCGLRRLGLASKPTELKKKQAVAAVGQVALMESYDRLFSAHGIKVGQVLLTRGDFQDRSRYLNARATVLTLLEFGVLPVINENDTVAVDEIKFGDNDRLSALVASKIDADLLIMLTDVDGLYSSFKKERGPSGSTALTGALIPVVPQITPEVERLARKDVKSALGTGGMYSKIMAAKIAVASGVTAIVANGFTEGLLTELAQGRGVGTRFLPNRSLSARERWILFGAIPKGKIWVDEGAQSALIQRKKSLLPAGILEVDGLFSKGDVVLICSRTGEELGRGVSAFSSAEVQRIQGKKTVEIQKILGQESSSFEVVHRSSFAVIV